MNLMSALCLFMATQASRRSAGRRRADDHPGSELSAMARRAATPRQGLEPNRSALEPALRVGRAGRCLPVCSKTVTPRQIKI